VHEPLIVQLYSELPTYDPADDPDLWTAKITPAINLFRLKVLNFYTEGTLQSLLRSDSVRTRRAALLALGLVGTIDSNLSVANCLRDEDKTATRLAQDACWEIWFRAGTTDQNHLLQEILATSEYSRKLAGLDTLISQAPSFAEVYNQRAILHFQHGDFIRSIRDCERTLELNPHHFGAQAGIGQCYLKLQKYHSAMQAFQQALELNPNLEHLQETIESLRQITGVDDPPSRLD
jgi:tetratricopeptide (TPR) repeat protein